MDSTQERKAADNGQVQPPARKPMGELLPFDEKLVIELNKVDNNLQQLYQQVGFLQEMRQQIVRAYAVGRGINLDDYIQEPQGFRKKPAKEPAE